MRKSIAIWMFLGILVSVPVLAEEMTKEVQAAAETTASEAKDMAADAATQAAEPAAPVVEQAATEAVAPVAEAAAAAPAAVETPAQTDNLEFVSGEVSASNEAAKSVTVKLYGETDNEPTEKTITVTIDENTDITDGETDKDIKALNVGTEVDVEYDPKTNKATYIFVY